MKRHPILFMACQGGHLEVVVVPEDIKRFLYIMGKIEAAGMFG